MRLRLVTSISLEAALSCTHTQTHRVRVHTHTHVSTRTGSSDLPHSQRGACPGPALPRPLEVFQDQEDGGTRASYLSVRKANRPSQKPSNRGKCLR